MIFVTVGTTEFNTLIRAVDSIKGENIIIQKANGSYLPKNYPYFDFCPDITKYYKEAEIIITHGGAGTLFALLKMGKKVIGVANNERADKHQSDILNKFAAEGQLVWCKDVTNIEACIQEIRQKKLKRYSPIDSTITSSIKVYLEG